jgi:hypothetical protein
VYVATGYPQQESGSSQVNPPRNFNSEALSAGGLSDTLGATLAALSIDPSDQSGFEFKTRARFVISKFSPGSATH